MLSILRYGLSVAAVGILTVFVALIILIGLIKVMEIVVGSVTKKKAVPAPAPAAPAISESVIAGARRQSVSAPRQESAASSSAICP